MLPEDHDQVRESGRIEILTQGTVERVAAAGDHALRDARERRRQGAGEAAVHRVARVVEGAARPADAAVPDHAGGGRLADSADARASDVVAPVSRPFGIAQLGEPNQFDAIAKRDRGGQREPHQQVQFGRRLLAGEPDLLGADAKLDALKRSARLCRHDADHGQRLLGDRFALQIKRGGRGGARLVEPPRARCERERREQQQRDREPRLRAMAPDARGAQPARRRCDEQRDGQPARVDFRDADAGHEGQRPEHQRGLIEAAHGGVSRMLSITSGAMSQRCESLRMPSVTSSLSERIGCCSRCSMIASAVVRPMPGSASSSARVA